jgi:hypothetical protein|tara:strand:+ start:2867 stop:3097 length:231 start_codon:yes stop_codon:yes gene_type:complete
VTYLETNFQDAQTILEGMIQITIGVDRPLRDFHHPIPLIYRKITDGNEIMKLKIHAIILPDILLNFKDSIIGQGHT